MVGRSEVLRFIGGQCGVNRLGMSLCLALGLACAPKDASQNTVAPQPDEATATPRVDPQRLFGTVETLASDGLGGRYSLHPDIGRAADYLATELEHAGAQPVGQTYRHDFELMTGARLTEEPRVSVTVRGRTKEIAEGAFVPLAESGSGQASGPVVFVGYAAKAQDAGAGYDDLAGLQLQGKIALLLHDGPRRPSARALYAALRRHVRSFDRQAEPLREAKDSDAAAALYEQTAMAMAAVVRPFLGGRSIPEALLKPPADPLAEDPFDVSAFANLVFDPPSEAGPAFSWQQGRLDHKLDRLQEAGIAGVIVVRGPASFVDPQRRDEDPLPELEDARSEQRRPFPVVQMKWARADELFRIGGRPLSKMQREIDRKLQPRSRALPGITAELAVAMEPIMTSVPNVLAMIPGGDLKDEVVLLGAHYDHIGVDEEGHGHCEAAERDGKRDAICNGADDNASGTAVVVEIARVLAARSEPPRRTVVFALFAGEELGLHGSKALAVAPPEVPPFSTGKLTAMVNVDMVGRLDQKGLMIGGIGSSPAWMPMLEELGHRQMPILYDRSTTTRSDHASFYRKDIPVLFFFTGTHADYHAPGDEADLINRDGLASIASLILDLTERLASGHEVPFAKPQTEAEGLVRALPGDNPETIEKKVGFEPVAADSGTPSEQ